jgi:hypothetical protein
MRGSRRSDQAPSAAFSHISGSYDFHYMALGFFIIFRRTVIKTVENPFEFTNKT